MSDTIQWGQTINLVIILIISIFFILLIGLFYVCRSLFRMGGSRYIATQVPWLLPLDHLKPLCYRNLAKSILMISLMWVFKYFKAWGALQPVASYCNVVLLHGNPLEGWLELWFLVVTTWFFQDEFCRNGLLICFCW